MIIDVMSFKVPDSQNGMFLQKTIEWGKQFTKYLGKRWPKMEPVLLENVNGEWGRLHLVIRFESMAHREKWWDKEMGEDTKLMALMQELVELENQHGGTPFLTKITNNFYHIIDLD